MAELHVLLATKTNAAQLRSYVLQQPWIMVQELVSSALAVLTSGVPMPWQLAAVAASAALPSSSPGTSADYYCNAS